MSQVLKPCPFCGSSPMPNQQLAQCSNSACPAFHIATKDHRMWNSRAPVQPAVVDVDFWTWLDSAYRLGSHDDHPKFTKYNMEVAFAAGRAHSTRLQAEIAALQQRLTVADEQVDILSGGLRLMTSFGSGTNIAGVKTVAKQTLNRAAGVALKADQTTSQ
jgi:hypothetical protein